MEPIPHSTMENAQQKKSKSKYTFRVVQVLGNIPCKGLYQVLIHQKQKM
jgi:hypothetical protein